MRFVRVMPPKILGVLRFYGEWLNSAFVTPFRIAGGIALVIAILGGLYVHKVPQSQRFVGNLGWQVPLVVFAGLLLFYIFRAPYVISEKRKEAVIELMRRNVTLEREKQTLESEYNALRTARADRQAIRTRLDQFIHQGDALATELNRPNYQIGDQHTDVMGWVRAVYVYVGTEPLTFSAWLIQGLDIQEELTPLYWGDNSREARERRDRDSVRILARLADPARETARLQTIIRTINERLSELLHRQGIG